MTYMTVERRGNTYVPTAPSDTMSVAQLARALGWCTRTTYARLRDGSIPARRVGSRWVISRRRIEAFLHGEGA